MTLSSLEDEIIQCRKCARLVSWREEVARKKRKAYLQWEYWGKPVPGFGDPLARVLVVGLAPGAHGSNRTGRMFTGDSSGEFLYAALYRVGMASQPTSFSRDDNLVLSDIFISAVCRCVPPGNKPLPTEIHNCIPFLKAEIAQLKNLEGIVCLGRIAFEQVIRLTLKGKQYSSELKFKHGAFYDQDSGSPWLIASYHPSQQNTQTGRLTMEMFDKVWREVKNAID